MEQQAIDITERKKQFFERIKRETNDLHRLTESSPLSAALVSDEVNRAIYTDYLSRMKDIVTYYEAVVFDGLAPLIPGIDQRRKLHHIENDLAWLNAGNNSTNFSLPRAGTTAQLLGYMYVLEGSSLGGAMIYKHVSRYIDISEQNGGSFFTCYKAELSARWKHFLDILGEHSLDEKKADEIIAGARIAFKAIYEHLSYYKPGL